MNKMFGFENECIDKYDKEIFSAFQSLFSTLPIAHVINKKVFVVHGGLCSSSIFINDLQNINRFSDSIDSGPLCELLWSDPMDQNGLLPSPRGIAYSFGPDVTKQFLDKNGLTKLVRSHQVQDNGYSITQNGQCITVFSAPNYVGTFMNKGAILFMSFDQNGTLTKQSFETFSASAPNRDYPPMKYSIFRASI